MPDQPAASNDCPPSDYDGAWKELLERFLEAILRCFFPAVAQAIDWTCKPEFLEQELRSLLANEQSMVQRMDQLIKVRLENGQIQWLLIHLEIQSFQEAEFERRIYRYHQLIEVHHQRETISMVILGDLNANWRPSEYISEILGCVSQFRFLTCKLLDMLPSLEGDFSLPAMAARMQIDGLRTTGEGEVRYLERLRILAALVEHGVEAAEANAIYRAMLRMFRVPPDLTLRFHRHLVELHDQMNTVPFYNEPEEMGRLLEAQRIALLLMERVAGPISDQLRSRVEAMCFTEQIESLLADLLQFRSSADLENWLDRHHL